MKSLQKRLSQLYEKQAIEEKKVLQSLQITIDNLSPFSNVKNSLSELMSSEESESYFSKKSFTLLLNKTIDSIVPKPEIINQTIKVLIQQRFVDVLFDSHKVYSKERELETNNTQSES
jgi:hypothetical protein